MSRGTAALLFLSAKALIEEPVVVCVLSNDKSDLSYQTNIARVQPAYEKVCVCVCGLCISPTHCVCNGSVDGAVCVCVACSHMFTAVFY